MRSIVCVWQRVLRLARSVCGLHEMYTMFGKRCSSASVASSTPARGGSTSTEEKSWSASEISCSRRRRKLRSPCMACVYSSADRRAMRTLGRALA